MIWGEIGDKGPVVGRKSCLTAALRLGIADPEESDTNAILGALHHHDRLAEGAGASDEVEIAILTGDVRWDLGAIGRLLASWTR